ncbi:MAG: IS91 family transposase [Bacilli bacterium]
MKYTIQDIFQTYGPEYIKKHNLSIEAWKVYNSIVNCKSKELGVHTITCEECGKSVTSFNSCRNRHCPMCQSYAREKWIHNESNYLLNCPYFHIVTTVPSELNEIFLLNKKELYNILFKATSESILELCDDIKLLGGKPGITSILHTWGQTLEFHPHIHSIVTGGGIKNNKWVEANKEYFFKVQILSSLFRGKFLSMLKSIRQDLKLSKSLSYIVDDKSFNNFLRPLYKKSWVTFIEPPKGSPENVIEYIGRYSFRVAISNERIKNINNGNITFEYKDYKDKSKIKIMTITADEFIRRFLMHVLPKQFTKIKHYGILANRSKKNTIKLCRILLGQKIFSDFSINLKRTLYEFKCSCCGSNKFNYNFSYNNNHNVFLIKRT